MEIDIILGIFLLICSLTDLKSREIKPVILCLFAAAGVILYITYRPVGLFEEIAGIFIGLFFVAVAVLTDEKLGLGDGLLMCVTGIYLGGRENAMLIMIAMFLSALFSAGVLILKKADKKTRLAFVPFVFAAFLLQVSIRRFS